ncbi:MAG TPA: endonuclease/exonuclease/phosphatase family protein, partial [Solirubrobacteraceae bacterium]|nr:endonuclease/exonuclease/phosphatase family protein [Solirubrobacteraceae bacterium]
VAVLPRAVSGQPADPEMAGATLTVMSSNLYVGRGSPEAVLRLAREQDVDVLALEELTPDAIAAFDAAGAERLFPERVVEARPNGAGSAVLARRGIVERTTPDPAYAAQPSALIRLPFARAVEVTVVHPYPPITPRRAAGWKRKLRALPSADRPDGPLRVLAGDFNATLDHDALRDLIARGYVDAADATGKGLKPTWPVGRPRPGITIDHVLADRRIAVRDFSVHEIPRSDHRAIVAVLRVPRS